MSNYTAEGVLKERYETLGLKGYTVKFLFSLGGSARLLFYSVGAMESCSYTPQIMLNNVF